MFPGIYILFSLSVSSEKRTMKTDDGRDVKDSTLLSERMVSVIEAPDYLASFHIDTSGEAEGSNMPHYIVNLNIYNTTTDIDAPSTLPIHGQVPGIGESSASLQPPVMNSPVIMNDNVGLMCGVNSTGRGQKFFTPTMRSKTRGRGRFSSVPLDDV
ncbi:unnamed protein product [Schistosoma bovis]|nr:unnamed protein product [Schistosoma bovis]CAH8288748.1 unnamed protein product [Schistosoma bovis]